MESMSDSQKRTRSQALKKFVEDLRFGERVESSGKLVADEKIDILAEKSTGHDYFGPFSTAEFRSWIIVWLFFVRVVALLEHLPF
jgi:hypothetical protein